MIKLKKEKEKITSHKSTSDRHGIILLKAYVLSTLTMDLGEVASALWSHILRLLSQEA